MTCSELCLKVAKLITDNRDGSTGNEWESLLSSIFLRSSSASVSLLVEVADEEWGRSSQRRIPVELWRITSECSSGEPARGVDPLFVESAVRSHLHFSPLASWTSSKGIFSNVQLHMRLISSENMATMDNFDAHSFPPSKVIGNHRCLVSVNFLRTFQISRYIELNKGISNESNEERMTTPVGSPLDAFLSPKCEESATTNMEVVLPPSDLFSSSAFLANSKLGSLALTPVSPDDKRNVFRVCLDSPEDSSPKYRAIESIREKETECSSARREILRDFTRGKEMFMGMGEWKDEMKSWRSDSSSPAPSHKIDIPLPSNPPSDRQTDHRRNYFLSSAARSLYKIRNTERLWKGVANKRLLGSFEESALNGRLKPAKHVTGFSLQIAASSQFFSTRHISLPVDTYFYEYSEDSVPPPSLGICSLKDFGRKGFRIPSKGTLQASLFNTTGAVVHVFVISYDLSEMSTRQRTFIRHRTFWVEKGGRGTRWLRHLVHLKILTDGRGNVRLHSDVRILCSQNHTLDTINLKMGGDEGNGQYEVQSSTETPTSLTYLS